MNVAVISIILTILLIFAAIAAFAFVKWRKILREAKNFERGLKMVPMLIHLPPSSEDIEVGSRDSRDVSDEAISKAQTLYDIIASTATKGFKSKFYGQRHISFEIVAVKGMVHFYVAVPVALVEVVQQAVISAYPAARLEEVSEHNIFSPIGKISGTMGGELILKEDYYNPIATFQDTKRDSMTALLNSLSNLGEQDGAGIQIQLRPAKQGWDKRAQDFAKDKKEGKEKKGVNLSFIGQFFEALWKPPEGSSSKDEPKTLSGIEQAQIDAIESKTKHAGYETLIRVVSSSNTSQKAQVILNNIVATFALFDAPGKNGFKFNEAKDIESFATAYIMRFFPPEAHSNILNSVELATIFHFPDLQSTPTSQLGRQDSKQVDGPRNMPTEGMLLGYNVFRGVKKEVRLSDDDRRRHLYIVGQTGTGKSTALENLALQDMLAGKGFAFVDPHGDAVDRIMSMVPRERTEDIIYFSPGDMDYPMGLNLYEYSLPEQKDFLIQEAINMLYKLYDPQRQGIIGPRYEHWFRNASLTLMADPEGSTFIDIPKVFTDNQYAKQKLKHVTDQTVLDFWNKEMAQTSDYHKSEVLGWFVSKFGAFLSNEMMRNIIGQTKSSFDLREVMDEGKILLVNLSKGRTGELNSKLLGMIFVMKFQAAAMSRSDIPEDQRKDFSLYVDEFQNFSTDSFATILSEARKYRLNLIVANQFISQLTDEIRDAVFGNVGSVMSFRTGATDAEFLVKQFSPVFDVDDLVKLPNFNTVSRLMVNNVPSSPFSMATLPPLGHANPELAVALKRLSAAKYGRPRATVEKAIFKRLETIAPPRPKFGAGPPGSPAGAALRRQPGAPGSGRAPATGAPSSSTFLDDWLAKRKQKQVSDPTKPQRQVANNPDEFFSKSTPASKTVAPPPMRELSELKAHAEADRDSLKEPETHDDEAAVNELIHANSTTSPPPAKPTPTKQPSTAAPVQPVKPQPETTAPANQQPAAVVKPPSSPKSPTAPPKTPAHKAPSVIPAGPAPNVNVSGEQKDKQDISDISKALKEDMNKIPEPTPENQMTEDDDMYIDKDGNIHYRDELQDE